MSRKDFLLRKIGLLKKDGQEVFSELSDTAESMAENNTSSETVEIGADGNWFTVSFDAIEVKKDRLVITAERKVDRFLGTQYVVEFNGTRAAYLRGYYEYSHRIGGWPYIHWDVRSYANHPRDNSKRVYVQGFYAHDEIKKLIQKMEAMHGTSNIVNSYINDNLARFKMGIMQGKNPEEIEKGWSRGMMESLGYKFVEASDMGMPKGKWNEVKVHWFKNSQDRLSK